MVREVCSYWSDGSGCGRLAGNGQCQWTMNYYWVFWGDRRECDGIAHDEVMIHSPAGVANTTLQKNDSCSNALAPLFTRQLIVPVNIRSMIFLFPWRILLLVVALLSTSCTLPPQIVFHQHLYL